MMILTLTILPTSLIIILIIIPMVLLSLLAIIGADEDHDVLSDGTSVTSVKPPIDVKHIS